jgi:hypothetical protein
VLKNTTKIVKNIVIRIGFSVVRLLDLLSNGANVSRINEDGEALKSPEQGNGQTKAPPSRVC